MIDFFIGNHFVWKNDSKALEVEGDTPKGAGEYTGDPVKAHSPSFLFPHHNSHCCGWGHQARTARSSVIIFQFGADLNGFREILRSQVWMCTTTIWIVDRKCHWNNEGVTSFKGQDRILREVIASSHVSFIWTPKCHCLRVGRLPNTTQMNTRKCTVIQIHVSFFFDHAANRKEKWPQPNRSHFREIVFN